MGDVYASEKYLPPSSLASAVPAVQQIAKMVSLSN
jgi:hypothetical protein